MPPLGPVESSPAGASVPRSPLDALFDTEPPPPPSRSRKWWFALGFVAMIFASLALVIVLTGMASAHGGAGGCGGG